MDTNMIEFKSIYEVYTLVEVSVYICWTEHAL